MTRIVHISDLHFGTEIPELLDPLRSAIQDAQPDLVAVTGDLTQRARRRQFRAARAFLDSLGVAWTCVPGNHDMPLDAFWYRLLTPFARYRKYIDRNLAPVLQRDGISIQGLNTADPYVWQRGRVRRWQLWRACVAFRVSDGMNIVLAHHPFEHFPGTDKTLMKRAEPALKALAEAGAHVILSGHLHRWRAEPFLSPVIGNAMLQVHVGTGLSTRHRGQGNDFALLDVTRDRLEITRFSAEGIRFQAGEPLAFRLTDSGWQREDGLTCEQIPRDEAV